MKSISKLVGVVSYAFLLGLGLSDYPASAAKNTTSTDRIGGQAGMEGEKGKLQGFAAHSNGIRIGGQAGLEGEKGRLEGLATPSDGMRIGGQAGLKSQTERLEGIVDPSPLDKRKG